MKHLFFTSWIEWHLLFFEGQGIYLIYFISPFIFRFFASVLPFSLDAFSQTVYQPQMSTPKGFRVPDSPCEHSNQTSAVYRVSCPVSFATNLSHHTKEAIVRVRVVLQHIAPLFFGWKNEIEQYLLTASLTGIAILMMIPPERSAQEEPISVSLDGQKEIVSSNRLHDRRRSIRKPSSQGQRPLQLSVVCLISRLFSHSFLHSNVPCFREFLSSSDTKPTTVARWTKKPSIMEAFQSHKLVNTLLCNKRQH